jgi:pyruvate ferredoxin oxidoreductase beta subunit
VPVEEYLRPQRRFAHLFKKGAIDAARIAKIQKMADENIKRFNLLRKETETFDGVTGISLKESKYT